MENDWAELLALRVLGWLLEQDDIVRVFLGSTGLSASDLRSGMHEPELLAAVLDFTLMNDAWVLAAAGQSGVDPADLARARAVLPGGDAPHWS